MPDMGLSESWIEYCLAITDAARQKSHCVRRKVGAVIFKDKYIVATGFNGVPSGFDHCSVCYGGERVSGHGLDGLPCIHAEENAVAQCARRGVSCEGGIMFVSIMPCNRCLLKAIQAGIKAIYCHEAYYLDSKGEALRMYILDQAKRVNGFKMVLHQGGLVL